MQWHARTQTQFNNIIIFAASNFLTLAFVILVLTYYKLTVGKTDVIVSARTDWKNLICVSSLKGYISDIYYIPRTSRG
jgi:hypothetical protein